MRIMKNPLNPNKWNCVKHGEHLWMLRSWWTWRLRRYKEIAVRQWDGWEMAWGCLIWGATQCDLSTPPVPLQSSRCSTSGKTETSMDALPIAQTKVVDFIQLNSFTYEFIMKRFVHFILTISSQPNNSIHVTWDCDRVLSLLFHKEHSKTPQNILDSTTPQNILDSTSKETWSGERSAELVSTSETRNRLWRLNFPRTDRNPKPETRNPKPTLKT